MNQSVHVDARTNRFVLPPKRLQRDPNKAPLNKVLAQKLPYAITNTVGNFRKCIGRTITHPLPCRNPFTHPSTDNFSSSKLIKLCVFCSMVDISSWAARRS